MEVSSSPSSPNLGAMTTEMRDPSQLIPHPRNSRRHSNEQITALGRAMTEFGFHQPVMVDETNTILVGHARTLAAIAIGLAEIPVVVAKHYSEAQKRALIIADNRLHEFGAGWDEDLLGDELRALMAKGIDVSLTGFEVPEPIVHASAADEDDAPPLPQEPVSRLGDVWEMDGHRLVVGDAADPVVMNKALGEQRAAVNLMVTDPPYGVDYEPAWRNGIERANGSIVGARATGRVLNDDLSDWREVWALFPGDVAYTWHAGVYAAEVEDSLRAAGFGVEAQIVWAKPRFAIGRGNYHWQHEPCFYALRRPKGKARPKVNWQGGRQTTIWAMTHNRSVFGHGTQKPVEAMRRPILNHTRPGDVVLDPFLGTGTTIIAAQTCARRCVGVELSPLYADVVIERYQSFTNRPALLAGETFDEVREARR